MPKIPRSLKHDNGDSPLGGVYDWSLDLYSRPRRPLPSSNQMIITKTAGEVAEGERELSPLLTSFLAATGRQSSRDPTTAIQDTEGNDEAKSSEIVAVAAIDNPSRSTITSGQHYRYMKLLSSRQAGKAVPQKEFQNLTALVQAEQQRYCQAVVEFWETNGERLSTGFSPSSQSLSAANFVQLAAKMGSLQAVWRERLKDAKYGKFCQQISLLQTSVHNGKETSWTLDAIETHNVSGDKSAEKVGPPQNLDLPSVGSEVPCPSRDEKADPSVLFLEDDQTAMTIAERNNVSVVATLEALETMLNTENNQWVLPVNFRNGVALVDSPLPPSFSNPRACLAHGLNKGLAQWNELHGKDEDRSSEEGSRYRFVILDVPNVSSSAISGRQSKPKHTKVLVRVPNQSTRARAHVVYFPDRSDEIPSPFERSLWILDHYLFSRAVLARIDPVSCRVLKWEETSTAHALIGDDNTGMSFDSPVARSSMDHWHGFAQIIQAIPSIGSKGKFMLSFPGRGPNLSARSISVHTETKGEDVLEVERDLDRAGEVKLGPQAFRSCMRRWTWNDERIPYTFPSQTTGRPDHKRKWTIR